MTRPPRLFDAAPADAPRGDRSGRHDPAAIERRGLPHARRCTRRDGRVPDDPGGHYDAIGRGVRDAVTRVPRPPRLARVERVTVRTTTFADVPPSPRGRVATVERVRRGVYALLPEAWRVLPDGRATHSTIAALVGESLNAVTPTESGDLATAVDRLVQSSTTTAPASTTRRNGSPTPSATLPTPSSASRGSGRERGYRLRRRVGRARPPPIARSAGRDGSARPATRAPTPWPRSPSTTLTTSRPTPPPGPPPPASAI